MAKLLPIFPLDLVLFPGVPLPLHIFEPRYKEMIGECLDSNKHFGVVRVKQDEGIADTGCTAEITSVVKRYDDGRMDIATVGRRRFEIGEMNHERSFLQAEVLYLDDEESRESLDAEKRERALELYQQVQGSVGNTMEVDTDAELLSYQLAGALPIDLDFKQTLLGIRSELERLTGLIEFFEAILPRLQKAVRRREKAGGNGHVP
ncbi:MAG: LON peptidase substrate-binding domain-containing protein [Terriglobales bacterium]|jgi:Lon protease-like protein